MRAKRSYRFFKIFIVLFLLVLIISTTINLYIYKYSEKYIYNKSDDLPESHTALVLGAKVHRDNLSFILYDRISQGLMLYEKNKVKKLLLSGDHGKKYYDEVNAMKKFILKKNVPQKDIFLDHAGFNTYNSIVRAKKIFRVNNLIINTQRYHLYRAVYIARKKNINAFGFVSDKRKYINIKMYKFREFFANVKAFFDVLIDRDPVFLGKQISIYGDGRKSWD